MNPIFEFLGSLLHGLLLALIVINLDENRKYLTMKNKILKSKISAKESEAENKNKDI